MEFVTNIKVAKRKARDRATRDAIQPIVRISSANVQDWRTSPRAGRSTSASPLVVQDAAMSSKVTTSTSAGTSMWGPCAAIGLAAVLLFASASYAQGGRAPADGPVTGTAPNITVPVNPKTQSCTALKAQLNAAGEMSILSGPKGAWGDTFYGPAVPRCQFWQMPVFTYVKASDGLCGVGYICVEKLTFD